MTDSGTLLQLIRQVRAQRQATDALEGERLRLEGSLIEFVEEAWPFIDAAPYQPNWAIDALCEHLQALTEGRISRLLINFPPRCGKTIILHKPEEVIKSVMSQLAKHGKGIILVHDFKHHTAEAMPELIRQLKAGGYKVVHLVPKGEVHHRVEIRRNARPRGQAVVQQHAAGEQRHPHNRRIAATRARRWKMLRAGLRSPSYGQAPSP
jgi:hypothetical protein